MDGAGGLTLTEWMNGLMFRCYAVEVHWCFTQTFKWYLWGNPARKECSETGLSKEETAKNGQSLKGPKLETFEAMSTTR